MDDSKIRKRAPAAHVVYGVAQAMNSGLFSILDLVDKAKKFCPEEGPEMYSQCAAAFFRGTGIELHWRDNKICPTEFEYMTMTMDKWFPYIDIALRLMRTMSKSEQNFEKLTRIWSWFLSCINDYSDFVSSTYSEGKEVCDDMGEGKFTFPIIYSIKEKGNTEVYGNLLKIVLNENLMKFFKNSEMFCQQKKDIPSKIKLLEILHNEGTLEYTRNYLAAMHKEMVDEMNRLGGNPEFERVTRNVLDELLNDRPPIEELKALISR